MADKSEVKVSEHWAYRARANDQLARVEVLKLGQKRPPRVKIRFIDDEHEGREEWVPPARLKVLWNGVEEWIAWEQRWVAIIARSAQAQGSYEAEAAGLICDLLSTHDTIHWRALHRYAALHVTDVKAFEQQTGITRHQLLQYPDAFVEGDAVVAPWPALSAAARELATRNPTMLLERMDAKDREAEHQAVHGDVIRFRRHDDIYVEPEICARVDAEHRPIRDAVREWCGAEARQHRDELQTLRQEVQRLSALVNEAITTLNRTGNPGEAKKLQRKLGTVPKINSDRSTR